MIPNPYAMNNSSNPMNQKSENKQEKNQSSALNDLYHSLTEYCNHLSGKSLDNNNHDVNTSFSISSHAMRQRKLLRNITFELKQLQESTTGTTSTNNATNNATSTFNNEQEARNRIEYESFLLKGIGCNTINEIKIPCSSINLNLNRRQGQTKVMIIEYIRKVLDSVSFLLLEEYYERRQQHKVSTATSTTTIIETENDNDDDCILALLEFLNVAYTCFESNIIFASLQHHFDCHEFLCGIENNSMMTDGDNDDDDDSKGGHFCTVIDALLYFTLDLNENSVLLLLDEEMEDNNINPEQKENQYEISFLPPCRSKAVASKSSSCWNPTKIQRFAFSILTKGLLSAEYIQRYCTSSIILPDDNIDSVLGNEMGIRLIESHYNDIAKLVQMSMSYLSCLRRGEKHLELQSSGSNYIDTLSPTYQSMHETKLFTLACSSFLSMLFRTNASDWILIQIPKPVKKKVMTNLYSWSRIPIMKPESKYRISGGDDDNDDDEQSIYSPNQSHDTFYPMFLSTLAQSLLNIFEWKSPVLPMETTNDVKNDSIHQEKISSIVQTVFGTKTSNSVLSDISYRCSIHSFVHLCLSRDVHLKKVLKEYDLFQNDTPFACISSDLLMVLSHCVVSFPSCRQSLCKSLISNDDEYDLEETRLCNFLNAIVETGKDGFFYSTIACLSSLRVILSYAACGTRDELSSKSLETLFDFPVVEFISELIDQSLSESNLRKESHPTMCAIIDFVSAISNPLKLSCQSTHIIEGNSMIDTLCLVLDDKQCPASSDNICPLLIGMRLGAATALGQICRNDYMTANQIKNTATTSSMKKILKRFANNYDLNSASFCILDYAINQSGSRELTRRALKFQSVLTSLINHNDDFLTCAIFTIAREKESLELQSTRNLMRYKAKLEKLSRHCENIAIDRDNLEYELTNKDAFYKKQINHVKQQSIANAVEQIEILAEEKLILQHKLDSTTKELSESNSEIKRVRDQKQERERVLEGSLEQLNLSNQGLKDQISEAERIIYSKNEDIGMKENILNRHEANINDLLMQAEETEQEKSLMNARNDELQCMLNEGKKKLEDSLTKLISLAKVHIMSEKNNKNEIEKLEGKVEIAERRGIEVMTKYKTLKEMYRSAGDKVYRLSNQLQKAKSEIESFSSKKRQPMGTLAFMNSMHDNSMRYDGKEKSSKDYSTSINNTRTKASRIKKSSSYRIVR